MLKYLPSADPINVNVYLDEIYVPVVIVDKDFNVWFESHVS